MVTLITFSAKFQVNDYSFLQIFFLFSLYVTLIKWMYISFNQLNTTLLLWYPILISSSVFSPKFNTHTSELFVGYSGLCHIYLKLIAFSCILFHPKDSLPQRKSSMAQAPKPKNYRCHHFHYVLDSSKGILVFEYL